MAAAISTSSLYPVVREIDEEEYGTCCCIDGTVMSRFSMQVLPPVPPNQSMHQRSQSDQSNNSSKFAKRSSLFQAKRRRSAVQRARSEGALIDASDTQTISTEAEEKKFEESFVLTRQIFRCQSSILWECVHRESGQRYCVKIFDRRRLGSVQEQEDVEREITLIQNAQGDMGIVQVLDVIDESEKVYLVMELLTGGNLLSKVVQKEGLCERSVKLIAKSLLMGVRHLHEIEICHNGLEPSNILLDATDGVKIGDFGHASRVGSMAGSPGTAAYMAPEVLQGAAPNAASDMWSIGVLLYFCLFGQTPFVDQSATSNRTNVSRIHKADYSFPTTEWNHVPRYAKQLISSLIHMDPTVRLTAEEALEHPWFANPVVIPVHYRRRPHRMRTVVQFLFEKMSLCRKSKKDAKVLACLPTNSSSPYSDQSIKQRGHRREESTSSTNRFYDSDA